MKRTLTFAVAVLASGLGLAIGHRAGADAASSWSAWADATFVRATDDSRDHEDEAAKARRDDTGAAHRIDVPMRSRDRFDFEPVLAARTTPGSAVAARDSAMH